MKMNKLLVTLMAGGAMLSAACGPAATPTTAPTAPTTVPSAATSAPAVPTVAPTTAGGAPQGVGLIKGPFAGEAQALNGAGATFPAVLYSKWFDEYAKLTNVKVNYQAIGSGGGIKGVQDATVDFGASDGPMSDDQLKAAKGDVLHIPMTLGAVVMTYNIPEAKAALKFTGDTIAGIYLGDIKKWNDPRLVADNPDLKNIDKDIVVVHRSDGSGTTYAFTDYLSLVSDAWKTKVGRATSVNWPTGLGGQGNAGVTGEVKQDTYAIGYVELIYAVQNKLGYGDVKNKSGKWVTPSLESVTAAAAATADKVPADLRVSIANADGDTVYPISTFTWIIVYAKQTDGPKAIALTRLLWWAVHDGQKFSGDLGYAPLPAAIVAKDELKILSISANGSPAFPGK
jgi:phosphate transport system substrate-binding protein